MVELATLLLSIAVILITTRAVSWLFLRVEQPPVVGEMIAGIMLGPSLLGWIAPDVSNALFPTESQALLEGLSVLGLVLFMFLVGMEHDPSLMRGRRRTAVLVSHASMTIPFALGTLLALFLYPRLGEQPASFTQFALFIGISVSITAFPVLARMLVDVGMVRTPVGVLALVCASVNDLTGWLALAAVLPMMGVGRDPDDLPPWLSIPGSVLFALLMLTVGRRLLARLGTRFRSRGLTMGLLVTILLVAILSAWTTEQLGVHPLFGAFVAGLAMPRDPGLFDALEVRLRDVTIALLLPLFFALSGLRTRVGLIAGAQMWLYFALVLGVAIAGKFSGAALSARAAGLRWREAASLGVLVNTRGLIELIVLNIGLEAGIISPALFAMLVLMAIVTTLMTMPLLSLLYPRGAAGREVAAPP